MKRPWQIWLVFGLCSTVVLVVMGWITLSLLNLERAVGEVQRKAAVEEQVRLALWRMDSAISPLIFQENARPYFDYLAFSDIRTVAPVTMNPTGGNDLVPSPLLSAASSNVMIYFNGVMMNDPSGTAGGWLSSPQNPTGELRRWVLDNRVATPGALDGNSLRFEAFRASVPLDGVARALDSEVPPGEPAAKRADLTPGDGLNEVEPQRPAPLAMNRAPAVQSQSQMGFFPAQAVEQVRQMAGQQDARNVDEYSARKGQASRSQQLAADDKQILYSSIKGGMSGKRVTTAGPSPEPAMKPEMKPAKEMAKESEQDVNESLMKAFWVNQHLILARRVNADGQTYIQGAWLNWDHIREGLLADIRELFPEARLMPAETEGGVRKSRQMAALPVELIPGPPVQALVLPVSPLRLPLMLAWGCALLAALAIGLLLVGAVSLSERRGAFVSAVTHELRTPLTTFRMYSEMLAEDMVPDPKQRQAYLDTLVTEGSRLSHLVENVLSYARLERGRVGGGVEILTAGEILDRVRCRLDQHARLAGMRVAIGGDEGAAGESVAANLSTVEQILFNLVDNACKYAGRGGDRRIEVKTGLVGRHITIQVRDFGEGISRADARKLFQPFRKSARHAAESAPGVGLGLALSRQLARQMGGDLRLRTDLKPGACFELRLPRAGNR